MSSELEKIVKELITFRKERNWEQFHNPKDLALSLSLEASEVLEHFQWKNGNELSDYVHTHKDAIGEELADVLHWVVLLAHDLDIDLIQASEKKLAENAKKYPVEKAKDSHTKYTEL